MKCPEVESKCLRKRIFVNARLACLGLVFIAMSGCGFKFAYNNLDWLLPWYIKSFVTLTEGQKDYLHARLPEHLEWHRRTQLQDYIVWLDQWADHVANGVERESLEQTNQQMQSLFMSLLQQTMPDIGSLLSSASAQQVAEMVNKLEEDNREFAKQIESVPSDIYRKQQVKSTQKTLQVWLGPLNQEQKKYLIQWSQRFVPVGEETILYRRVWLQQFKKVVADRHSGPPFRSALEQLIINPEQDWDRGYLEQVERNKDFTNALWIDVLNSLSDKQKQHALSQISDWKKTLQNLIED